jgi:hypothetical protein
VGAGVSAYTSNKASSKQASAARDANSTNLAMFNTARDDQMPWLEGGRKSQNELGFLLGLDANGFNNSLGANATAAEKAAYSAEISKLKKDPNYGSLNKTFTGANLENDPGYQFGLREGNRGMTNSAAARGGLLSGAALKEASRFNQDYAGTKFNDAFNRFNANQSSQFNRLATLAGVGQTSAAQVGQQGIATGNQIAQNQIGAGNARASGYIGQSNALTGGLSQGANWWQQNQALKNSGNSMAGYNGAYSNLDFDVGNMS